MSLFLTNNFTPSFIHYLCASGTKFRHVKIANTVTVPTKWVRNAVYTGCKDKGCNIVYTYLYTTAANEVAHLPTKFTLHKRLGGYFATNCQYRIVQLAYIHHTELAGAIRWMDRCTAKQNKSCRSFVLVQKICSGRFMCKSRTFLPLHNIVAHEAILSKVPKTN